MVTLVGGAGRVAALAPGATHNVGGSGKRTALVCVQRTLGGSDRIDAGNWIAIGVIALVVGGEDGASCRCAGSSDMGIDGGG